MAISAPITLSRGFNTAFATYSSALPLRSLAACDDEVERAEDAIGPLFDAVVSCPALDLASVLTKLGAIVGEYADGHCPVEAVEYVMRDLLSIEAQRGGVA